MAADAWVVYNKFKQNMAAGANDQDADTFKARLYNSSSNAASAVATISADTDITNELATAVGYTAGGFTLTGVTWTESAGTVTFDFADPSWTASGGNIVAHWAAIVNSTSLFAVGYSLLDNSPADVTTTDGNTLTIVINASGMFTLA